jgi:hypothetical protein
LRLGQREGESCAAKLTANAPRVKQSNIPRIAKALKSLLMKFFQIALT